MIASYKNEVCFFFITAYWHFEELRNFYGSDHFHFSIGDVCVCVCVCVYVKFQFL